VWVPLLMSTNGSQGLADRIVLIQNVRFAHPGNISSGNFQPVVDICMDTSEQYDPSYYNTTAVTTVEVSNYNGVPGNNFQAYFDGKQPSGTWKQSDVYGWCGPA
jgi:hypothetical protein